METIKLPHGVWHYDPSIQLGPEGGFGAVFSGYSERYGNLAVKKIKVNVQDLVHRELRIATELLGTSFQHIIPIYDAGLDADTGVNFVVMARAEKSLQDELKHIVHFSENDAIDILLQIVQGLLEAPKLVHRDLKPGNILFHEGKWKVADFGIAKFVEESTSLQTLNDCLSPQYAAPEQWEYQRPTNAVDVYALGCIGYTLVTGHPPFSGNKNDLKYQHLNSEPPTINLSNPKLKTLIFMMLRKSPVTRPSLERVHTYLDQMSEESEPSKLSGLNNLSSVAAELSEKAAKAEAARLAIQNIQKERERTAKEARRILSDITSLLFERITSYAPNAINGFSPRKSRSPRSFQGPSIELEGANLFVDLSRFLVVPEDAFHKSKWDVITGAIISVFQDLPERYEWSANLWYTNLGKQGEYRWWEVSYMTSPLMPTHPQYEPYAVVDLAKADLAAAPGVHEIQFGTKLKLIDDECVDEFCDRWADLLAKAASGQLTYPRSLPIR